MYHLLIKFIELVITFACKLSALVTICAFVSMDSATWSSNSNISWNEMFQIINYKIRLFFNFRVLFTWEISQIRLYSTRIRRRVTLLLLSVLKTLVRPPYILNFERNQINYSSPEILILFTHSLILFKSYFGVNFYFFYSKNP